MFQLMVDRSNAQIALQTFESRFDLCQLHVSIPQYGWIFGYQVRAQQIVAIPQLRFFRSRRASFLRRIAISLACRPSLLASTYNSPPWANSFTSTDSRTFRQGNSSHFFSYCLTFARDVPTR